VTSHNVKSKCFSPIAQTDTSGYLAIPQYISNNRDVCSVAPHLAKTFGLYGEISLIDS